MSEQTPIDKIMATNGNPTNEQINSMPMELIAVTGTANEFVAIRNSILNDIRRCTDEGDIGAVLSGVGVLDMYSTFLREGMQPSLDDINDGDDEVILTVPIGLFVAVFSALDAVHVLLHSVGMDFGTTGDPDELSDEKVMSIINSAHEKFLAVVQPYTEMFNG